jgi:hypothetical protein
VTFSITVLILVGGILVWDTTTLPVCPALPLLGCGRAVVAGEYGLSDASWWSTQRVEQLLWSP